RATRDPDGHRQSDLGLLPPPGSPSESGASHRQADSTQYPASPPPGARPATPQGGYELAAVSEAALGGSRRHRLLHRRSRHVAWARDLLWARGDGTGDAPGADCRYHTPPHGRLHAAVRPTVDQSLRWG